MNKKLLLLIFLQVATQILSAQYSDPNIPKPASGYGADGPHTVGTISFANPAYPAKDIQIFYPSDIIGKVPTLFYSHAFGGNNSANILGMLEFVAKKGYAIVFVPYQTVTTSIDERYSNLLNGFRKAARDYPNIIDTTKVGFMGHSFGGGASFANAYKCFTENNWGSKGRFIYALAQWYSYNISQAELQNFPPGTKLLTELFDDDDVNDHRLAIDIFNNINISPGEKDCLLLRSDTINNYIYLADHTVPNISSAFDALDYYGYYRFIDALCDYTFNGNAAAKQMALGNGSASQINMPGGLKPLVYFDYPLVLYPQSRYQFPCTSSENPRQTNCPSNTFTFTGNGNWSEPANWLNRAMPPASLSGNMFIIIDPVAGGECILNVPQQIGNSTQVIVNANKKLIINGNLVISK
jgi:dienelactone hydrolase